MVNTSRAGSRVLFRKCYCRLPAVIERSHTSANPGRLFWGCPNWKFGEKRCDYFAWVDEDDLHGDSDMVEKMIKEEKTEQVTTLQLATVDVFAFNVLLGFLAGLIVGIFLGFFLGRL